MTTKRIRSRVANPIPTRTVRVDEDTAHLAARMADAEQNRTRKFTSMGDIFRRAMREYAERINEEV